MEGGGGGLSLMTFWNSEKLSNFKTHDYSWTINESCSGILIVATSCSPIAHIHRWNLWKKQTKKQTKKQKKKKTKKKQHIPV